MIILPTDLPADVRRLLWRDIDSEEKLEVLRYTSRIEGAWSTSHVAAALDLPEPDVAFATVSLWKANLVTREGYAYRRTDLAVYLAAAIDVLYRAYAEDPAQVLRGIEALARNDVRATRASRTSTSKSARIRRPTGVTTRVR